jgi:chorismate synthase
MLARGNIMASNALGNIFKITTWGESHGKAIGVVIDGCPAGIKIDESEINTALALRAPGKNAYTSPRMEVDQAEILSGVFEDKTTGAPISIIIPNKDVDSSKYEPIKAFLRPGHANFTYLEKYGIFDYRGGGRSSARETACRVAAGAVARKFLQWHGINVTAYIKQIGTIEAYVKENKYDILRSQTYENPLFCPDVTAAQSMMTLIEQAKIEGDSLGGIVEFVAYGVSPGLGDPIYEKLEANLAHAMMSIPASKGVEIGSGFQSAFMQGSQHNDKFVNRSDKVETSTNYAGGILGGISTGMPIVGRVAFKPTSSIMKRQETLTTNNESASFQLPNGSRQDPCVAIRAVPIVEAMVVLILADAMLMQRCTRL